METANGSVTRPDLWVLEGPPARLARWAIREPQGPAAPRATPVSVVLVEMLDRVVIPDLPASGDSKVSRVPRGLRGPLDPADGRRRLLRIQTATGGTTGSS